MKDEMIGKTKGLGRQHMPSHRHGWCQWAKHGWEVSRPKASMVGK